MSNLFARTDDDDSTTSIGGHNLRRNAPGRALQRSNERPRSVLSPIRARPGDETRRVLGIDNTQGPDAFVNDDIDDADDDDGVTYVPQVQLVTRGDGDSTNGPGTNLFGNNNMTLINNNDNNNDGDIQNNNIDNDTEEVHIQAPVVTFTQGQMPPPPPPPPYITPPSLPSALGAAALRLEQRFGHTFSADLEWQSAVAGDATKIKAFCTEVLQSRDLIVFAYMRPGAATIQLLHSATTFSLHGGSPELRGSDFAFIGDRGGRRSPAAVILGPDQPWKWDSKRAVLDIGRLEMFYANPDNAGKLWKPTDAAGEQEIRVPRLLALPPPLVRFCAEDKRTPYDLHQFVAQHALGSGGDDLLDKCRLVLDWCLVAAHCDSSPTTSILNLSMRAAPADDDMLADWLLRQLDHTLGPQATTPIITHPPLTFTVPQGIPPQRGTPIQPPPTTQLSHQQPPQQHTPPLQAPPPPPPPQAPAANAGTPAASAVPTQHAQQAPPAVGAPPDIWAQVATQLSQGMASVAAALNPGGGMAGSSARGDSSSYEEGGKFYDTYQLAVLKGFSHTHHIPDVPLIWPMFQHTKHMDTHRDNIKRKMKEWAARPDIQAVIDRSLYLSNAAMKDILALRFNQGSTTAELPTIDCGMSILICRPLSNEARAAIKRREASEDKSRAMRTFAEEEALQAEKHITTCPEDYNELLRCLGTYCALLHTLFGDRCMFFRHCFLLWTVMNSDYVLERRAHFSALFCRQVVWAIIEEGRYYFSQRMSPDDFTGMLPYEIKYPHSSLYKLEDNIKDQTPILRSSFPAAWGGAVIGTGARTVTHTPTASLFTPPLQAVQMALAAPSVVSGLSAGTGQQRGNNAPRPIHIRGTNVHPTIKSVMEPFITRCNGTLLGPMLERLNLTVSDLPQVPGSRVCYNFVLGRCSQHGCRNKAGHLNSSDVPDEFAQALMDTLRPAINHFMDAGPPANRVFAGRRRRD